MENFNNVLDFARKTIETELYSLEKLTSFLDENFPQAVEAILQSKGRVVITGIGKKCYYCPKDGSYDEFHRYPCDLYARC